MDLEDLKKIITVLINNDAASLKKMLEKDTIRQGFRNPITREQKKGLTGFQELRNFTYRDLTFIAIRISKEACLQCLYDNNIEFYTTELAILLSRDPDYFDELMDKHPSWASSMHIEVLDLIENVNQRDRLLAECFFHKHPHELIDYIKCTKEIDWKIIIQRLSTSNKKIPESWNYVLINDVTLTTLNARLVRAIQDKLAKQNLNPVINKTPSNEDSLDALKKDVQDLQNKLRGIMTKIERLEESSPRKSNAQFFANL